MSDGVEGVRRTISNADTLDRAHVHQVPENDRNDVQVAASAWDFYGAQACEFGVVVFFQRSLRCCG